MSSSPQATPGLGLEGSRETVAGILSGAVASGAFQAGALGEVMTALYLDDLRSTVFVGTSAGAINAARRRGRRVVAVGTTSVRSLETAAAGGAIEPFRGDTRLFIRPGYRFRAVDAMITNFHLPESTLLMLVCAFAGTDQVLAAYRHAVAERYRFFSYGDAMLLTSPLSGPVS